MRSTSRSTIRLLALGTLPVATGACSLAGPSSAASRPSAPVAASVRPATDSRPAAAPAAAPETASETAADRLTARVVSIAVASIGSPYEWGGTDANGFDCSGLIQYAYGRIGIPVPRRSTAQIRAGEPVDPNPALLRPGDVLGFSAEGWGATSHVGLYIGGDEFIHSSSTGVRISTLQNPYWQRRLTAARRIVD